MKIAIRTDSSINLGSGHLMRCLTLADLLQARGGSVSFLSRELSGNIIHLAEDKGYRVHRLASPRKTMEQPGNLAHADWLEVDLQTEVAETEQMLRAGAHPVDWLVVDHYALDKKWETQMRPFAARIMVIDDIADRQHDCDLLLDQNLYLNMASRYDGLVPTHCNMLLGPAYALLRPEFVEARKSLRQRDGSVKHILIFFGGSDPSNETAKALDALTMLNRPDIAVDVVVGHAYQHKDQIRQRCAARRNTIFHCQVENMAELMSRADLSIGAGGTTMWERCVLGLPSIIMSTADNQYATSEAVAAKGAIVDLKRSQDISVSVLAAEMQIVLDKPSLLREMSRNALALMGNGAVSKIHPAVQTLLGSTT